MFSAIHARLLQLVTTLPTGRQTGDRAPQPSAAAVPCNIFSGCMLFGYRRDA